MSEPDLFEEKGGGGVGAGAGRGSVQVLDLITSNFTMLPLLPARQLQLR